MMKFKLSGKAVWSCTAEGFRKYPAARYLTTLLLVTLSYFVMYRSLGCYYMTNDDPYMMRNLSGYFTGEPSSYELFVSTPMGLLYRFFYTRFPEVSWYSLFQVGSTVLCVSVVLFLLMEEIRIRNRVRRAGCTLLAVSFIAAVMVMPFHIMNFSVTAALYGVAALAILLSLAGSEADRKFYVKYAVCMAFVLLAQLIRASSYQALLPFLAFVFVYVLIRCRRKWSKRFTSAIIVTTVILVTLFSGVSVLDRLYKSKAVEPASYREMKSLRGTYMDHVYLPYDENAEFYESIGWDEELYRITRKQMFLDKRFNTGNLTEIVKKSQETTSRTGLFSRVKFAVNHFLGKSTKETITYEPVDMPQLLSTKKAVFLCFLLIFVGSSAALLRGLRRKRAFAVPLFLLAGVNGIATAEIVYLCFLGRFILRAFACAALPALWVDAWVFVKALPGILEGLDSRCSGIRLPDGKTAGCLFRRKAVRASSLLMAVCLAASIGAMAFLFHTTFHSDYRIVKNNRIADSLAIEEFCRAHPDHFYLHDGIATNKAVFPDMSEQRGCGRNLLFWGGAEVYTKSHYDAIRAFGYDSFTTENLLEENVYFLSLSFHPTESEFLSYMRAAYGEDVRCRITDVIRNRIYVYKFYRAQE